MPGAMLLLDRPTLQGNVWSLCREGYVLHAEGYTPQGVKLKEGVRQCRRELAVKGKGEEGLI